MKSPLAQRRSGAFTLVELLVVIAIIVILAALLLPTLAGAKRRAILAQCQSNFHQIGLGCNIYANDYNDYYPICVVRNAADSSGGDPINRLFWISQTRFIVFPGPPNTVINQGFIGHPDAIPPVRFDCLGLLYETRGISDGRVFFCPGFPDSSGDTPAAYSNPAFMSTDDSGLGVFGQVNGTMLFNPRTLDATNDWHRALPKTTSRWSKPGSGQNHLLGMDQVGNSTSLTSSWGPATFAHYPSQGFNCLFADGSVQFVQSVTAYQSVANGSLPGFDAFYGNAMGTQTGRDREAYDQLFDWLENAR